MNHPIRPSLLVDTISRLDARTVALATAVLWCAALGYYTTRLTHGTHGRTAAFDLVEILLIAAACLGFQLAALRVGIDQLAHIWHATIDPTSEPTPTNPTRWRVFGRIGAASWLATLILGVPAAAGAWHLGTDSTDLIFALVIVLVPAVQCSGAAIIGPILTHVIRERETAQLARRALLEIRLAAPRERSHHPGR